MTEFYKVKAVFEYPGSNKLLLEGIFIPKNEKCNPDKIKEQCKEYLIKQVKWGEGIDPEKIKIKISYTTMKPDFVVCEDKK